jgi:hypothetical protein
VEQNKIKLLLKGCRVFLFGSFTTNNSTDNNGGGDKLSRVLCERKEGDVEVAEVTTANVVVGFFSRAIEMLMTAI